MMDNSIYYDKVIMFESDARNAFKASCEIERLDWTNVMVFQSFILVHIDTRVDNECLKRTFDQTIIKAKEILDKYCINYKCKQLKF